MDVHSEAGTGLKVSLLVFALILIGTLVYFVIQQNRDLDQVYAAQDLTSVVRRSIIPPKVDTPSPTP